MHSYTKALGLFLCRFFPTKIHLRILQHASYFQTNFHLYPNSVSNNRAIYPDTQSLHERHLVFATHLRAFHPTSNQPFEYVRHTPDAGFPPILAYVFSRRPENILTHKVARFLHQLRRQSYQPRVSTVVFVRVVPTFHD